MIIGIIILVVVCGVIGWFISTSNSINRANNKIDEAKSGIEIQLVQRYNILTQSLNVAKDYVEYEKEIFTNLRKPNRGMSVSEINEVAAQQADVYQRLIALGENYPQLKSADMFMNLQKQLSEEELQYAASKRTLNANITRLNNLVIQFPSSIVCSAKGISKMEFVREEGLEAKKDINLSFR